MSTVCVGKTCLLDTVLAQINVVANKGLDLLGDFIFHQIDV